MALKKVKVVIELVASYDYENADTNAEIIQAQDDYYRELICDSAADNGEDIHEFKITSEVLEDEAQ